MVTISDRTNGRTNERTDERTDGRTDGRTGQPKAQRLRRQWRIQNLRKMKNEVIFIKYPLQLKIGGVAVFFRNAPTMQRAT